MGTGLPFDLRMSSMTILGNGAGRMKRELEFDADGIMQHRHASINDVRLNESDRLFVGPSGGPRRSSGAK